MKEEFSLEKLQQAIEYNLTNDGFLVPIIFMCTRAGMEVLDASEYMESDEGKDKLIDSLCSYIPEKGIYKIYIVSEAWSYVMPKDMEERDVKRLLQTTAYREKLPRVEVYQIIEITETGASMLCRQFAREDDEIVLGDTLKIDDAQLVRFAPVQKCLRVLN